MSNQEQRQRDNKREQGSQSSQDPAEGRPDIPRESTKNANTRQPERKADSAKTKLEEQNRVSAEEPAEGRPDAD